MYTLQHRIFFVSNLASRLFCTFPLSLYLLHPFFFSPPTFYPLYPHIYRYIQRKKERERETRKEKIIHFPTDEINRDSRVLCRRSLLYRLYRKRREIRIPSPSFHVTLFKSTEEEMPTQCRMTNEL